MNSDLSYLTTEYSRNKMIEQYHKEANSLLPSTDDKIPGLSASIGGGMKQTFYVHEYQSSNEDFFLSKKERRATTTAIGAVELDVQPLKKEVVKEITNPNYEKGINYLLLQQILPEDAYDVKVTYKVKES